MAGTASDTTTAAATAPLKPRQLQVARLKREEEEESWISGEELCTEGSSDDEAHTRSPAHHPRPQHPPDRLKCPARPAPTRSLSATSEPAQQTDPHLTETTRRLSLMGLEKLEAAGHSSPTSDEVEEQEEVMLWRPKRGSIKLPHMDLDPPAPSPLLEQVSG